MQNDQTWVCLRGLGRGNFHWGDFKSQLIQEFPRFQFKWLEYPGNGDRFKEKSPWEISAYIEDLRAQLKKDAVAYPVSILAVSFGGMVAVKWAEKYPNEISQLVLINTSEASVPAYQRLRPRSWKYMAGIFSLTVLGASKLRIEKQVLQMTLNSSPEIQQNLEQWAKYSVQHPVQPLNLIAQLWAARSVNFPDRAPVPTVLIASEADQMVSSQCSKSLALRWQVPLKIHPQAGHDLPLEMPQDMTRLFKECLETRP